MATVRPSSNSRASLPDLQRACRVGRLADINPTWHALCLTDPYDIHMTGVTEVAQSRADKWSEGLGDIKWKGPTKKMRSLRTSMKEARRGAYPPRHATRAPDYSVAGTSVTAPVDAPALAAADATFA